MSSPLLPSRRDGVQYLYMLAAFVVIVAGIRTAEPILNPLLLAVFLAIVCAPAYLALLRRGLSQWLALLIVAGSLSAVAVFSVSVVMDSISRFTSQQAHYAAQAEAKRDNIKHVLKSLLPSATEDGRENQNAEGETTGADIVVVEQPKPPSENSAMTVDESDEAQNASEQSVAVSENSAPGDAEITDQSQQTAGQDTASPGPLDWLYDQVNPSAMLSFAMQVAGSLSSLLSQLLLITLMVIFILLEVGTFEHKLKLAFSRSKDTSEQGARMVHSVQRYVAIKTILSLATAILVGLWLRLFSMNYIALWMLLTFLLNFIPNVGSIAAAVPAVLIMWLDTKVSAGPDDSAYTVLIQELLPALGVAAGYVVINVAIGNFLEPRLMGRTLGLSPLVIFCSMIFWGWVLGPIGMLLSVPLTMTVHIILNGFDDTRWIATLMGAGTPDA